MSVLQLDTHDLVSYIMASVIEKLETYIYIYIYYEHSLYLLYLRKKCAKKWSVCGEPLLSCLRGSVTGSIFHQWGLHHSPPRSDYDKPGQWAARRPRYYLHHDSVG